MNSEIKVSYQIFEVVPVHRQTSRGEKIEGWSGIVLRELDYPYNADAPNHEIAQHLIAALPKGSKYAILEVYTT